MENLVGSAWGTFRVSENPMNGDVTITRCEEGNALVYVSPDYRHLFDQQPDGTYSRNEVKR